MTQIQVLGASYGKENVTDKARNFAIHEQTFDALIETWGDNWFGVKKCLSIVLSRNGGAPETHFWLEQHDKINLQQQVKNGHSHPVTGVVRILGATWGNSDVTEKIHQKVQNDSVEIHADWQVLGDPCPGNPKALTVVYQDVNGTHTAVVPEGGVFSIKNQQNQVNVLGASYGKNDVTDKLRQLVSSGQPFDALIETWGDNWFGVKKCLTVVVSRNGGAPETHFWLEQHEKINLSQTVKNGHNYPSTGILRVLGATFGNSDVTERVAQKVQNGHVEVKADWEVLGDPCPGNAKALTVVYQNGTGLHTAVVPEGGVFKL